VITSIHDNNLESLIIFPGEYSPVSTLKEGLILSGLLENNCFSPPGLIASPPHVSRHSSD
jgi:hypothetical protein